MAASARLSSHQASRSSASCCDDSSQAPPHPNATRRRHRPNPVVDCVGSMVSSTPRRAQRFNHAVAFILSDPEMSADVFDEALRVQRRTRPTSPLQRCGGRARQLGARSSFHQQRHIISDPTSIESRVHARHRRGDLVRRKMRILAGQTCLDGGDGSPLADLGHRDSFHSRSAVVNPSLIAWPCPIHLATLEPPVRRCRSGGGRRHSPGAGTATNPLRACRRDLGQVGGGRNQEPPGTRTQ
jgi:hypothetical protein